MVYIKQYTLSVSYSMAHCHFIEICVPYTVPVCASQSTLGVCLVTMDEPVNIFILVTKHSCCGNSTCNRDVK
jgi:hypothetical protein